MFQSFTEEAKFTFIRQHELELLEPLPMPKAGKLEARSMSPGCRKRQPTRRSHKDYMAMKAFLFELCRSG